jgi:hypothetical protein
MVLVRCRSHWEWEEPKFDGSSIGPRPPPICALRYLDCGFASAPLRRLQQRTACGHSLFGLE